MTAPNLDAVLSPAANHNPVIRALGRVLPCVVSLVISATAAHAQVFLNEPFSYADGRLVDVSGGVWAVHSGTTPLNVSGGVALLDQNDTTGGREDVNRLLSTTFDPLTDNISKIYGSFTVNFSALPVTGDSDGSYFAHLRTSAANEFYARIGANQNGAAPGMFRLAIANESWNVANSVEYGVDLSLNTTYRVVYRLDLATDQSTLWVDPVDESSPSVTATDPFSYSGSINAFALRQGTSGTGAPGDLAIDDVLVGQTFADVMPVPEPSTYALIGAGLAALFMVRRLRKS